ncbi:YncE family protein [Phyllobacterium leguminum]|uniref:YVTN family beta-propeller protein n=1 Tax=Phyllobacterium leguminum TaxID=314237 RepID=A0A318TEU3_9HYPH|nr:YncE family protein [Phyllobacterium leguminum]PYE90043.1 YVTN family beta-propeller protein [Phyllobacterium leguminum]
MNKLLYKAASWRIFTAMAGLLAVAVIAIPDAAQATSGNRAIASVSAFKGVSPNRVAFMPDGSKAYVPNTTSNTVSVIDAQTHKQLKVITLPAGSSPGNLAVTPDGTKVDGTKVYVLHQHSAISIIDTRTDELATTSTVQNYTGTNPYGIAFNPAKGSNVAYVTNNDAASSVSIIDTSTDTQTGTVAGYDGAAGAHDVAFAPSGTFAYVVTALSVVVIDVASNAQTQPVTGYTGTTPLNVAFAPDGSKAYVTNQGSSSVSVIKTSNHTQTGEVAKFNGINPAVVAFNPDAAIAYVTSYSSNSVSVIDITSDTQTGTVNLDEFEGNHPNGVAFRPDTDPDKAGDVAYVVFIGSDKVSVIQVHPAAAVITTPVLPSSGAVSGGTIVTIKGENLLDTTGVHLRGYRGGYSQQSLRRLQYGTDGGYASVEGWQFGRR